MLFVIVICCSIESRSIGITIVMAIAYAKICKQIVINIDRRRSIIPTGSG